MKKISLLCVTIFAACSSGNFHVENDFLNGFSPNKDRYYTHATQIGITKEINNEKETYSLGETVYTPSTKKPDASRDTLKKDRPYSGWAFGEYRSQTLISPSVLRTVGLQVGCLGRCSGAKEVQQTFHRLIGQGKPAWLPEFTQTSEPGFILEFEQEKRFWEYKDNADISIYGLSKFGNVIDSASLGSMLRLGYNLDTFAATPIVFKVSPEMEAFPRWVSYIFVKAEERGVAYNHLLDGSWWLHENQRVTSRPFVNEVDAGITLGYGRFKLTYFVTRFSSEWKEKQVPVAFGGVSFEW